MYLNNKLINIKKDFLKRKSYTKYEIKKLVLKSIIQSQDIKPVIRANAWCQLSKFKLKTSISKQNNNICLKTGRIKGVYKITTLSRHFMKTLAVNGSLQNIKINNW